MPVRAAEEGQESLHHDMHAALLLLASGSPAQLRAAQPPHSSMSISSSQTDRQRCGARALSHRRARCESRYSSHLRCR